jgi:hypothetical protein
MYLYASRYALVSTLLSTKPTMQRTDQVGALGELMFRMHTLIRFNAIAALSITTGVCSADVSDDFERYELGLFPGGSWQDASDFVTKSTIPSPTASMIATTDASGSATRAVQIHDALGTSGGIITRVEHQRVQRFEADLRFDQASDGRYPNWIAAAGFFQGTDEPDLISMPQAVIYSLNTDRKFRLYVHNADGNGGRTLDVVLGDNEWEMGSWYRVMLEVDTQTGEFASTVIDLSSGEEIIRSENALNNWESAFGHYDLISINDGEYGSQLGTVGNIATIDNVSYTPSPGVLVSFLAAGGVMSIRRRRG